MQERVKMMDVVISQLKTQHEEGLICSREYLNGLFDIVARTFEDCEVLKCSTQWTNCNITCACKVLPDLPEMWTKHLSLNNPEFWHLHDTGGGCMVVVSDTFPLVSGKIGYIGITDECIIVYTEVPGTDNWLVQQDGDEDWEQKDGFMKLVSILSSTCLNSSQELLDDIMSIYINRREETYNASNM